MPTESSPDALFERLRDRIAVERAIAPTNGHAETAPTFGAVSATLAQAARFGRVGDTLPSFDHLGPLRRLFARATGRVVLYFMRLVTNDQQRFNALAVRALRGVHATNRELHREIHALPDQLVPILRERDRRLDAHEDDLAERDRRLSTLEEALAERDQRLARLEEALHVASAAARAAEARLATVESEVAVAVDNLRAGAAVTRIQLDAVQRRTLAQPVTVEPGATPAPAPPAAGDPLLSALLTAEVLRASESEIAARQARYVSHFSGQRDVLDVGCGRGEFLEHLRAAGIPARGVDADADMVLRCLEKGLDVSAGDALSYLATLPDASLGGIFCAQVIEHWRSATLISLVHEAARTLAPGAPLLIETLNPESLLVLYRWYWVDLTHERLVHPETLQCLLRAAGFASVGRLEIAPPDAPLRIPPLPIEGGNAEAVHRFDAATHYLNELLYGPYDYAVLATR